MKDVEKRIGWSNFNIDYHMSKNHRYRVYKDALIIEESYPQKKLFMYHIVKNNDKKMTIKIDSDYIFGIYYKKERFKFAIPFSQTEWFLVDVDTFELETVDNIHVSNLEEKWFYEDFDTF